MEYLRDLFTGMNSEASYWALTWLVGSFIIGFATRYFMGRARRKSLTTTLDKARLELKQSKKQQEMLQDKYNLKEADYKKSSLELADRSKLVNNLELEKRQINSRLKGSLDDQQKAKAELTQMGSRLEELNDQIVGLRTKNTQLNAELQQSTHTINQYADTQGISIEQQEMADIIARLRSENASLKSAATATSDGGSSEKLNEAVAEISQLEKGNETLTTTVNKLIQENEDLKEKLEQLPQFEEGNAALSNSIMQLIAQNDALKEQVAELSQYESGNDILNATIGQLMEENDSLKGAPSTAAPVLTAVPTEAAAISNVSGEMSTEQAKAEIRAAIGNKIKAASPSQKDDLKKINGIGPFIEEKLNDLGIYTYEQLSQLDEASIPVLTTAIEFFPGRIERDEWVGQADRLFYMKDSSTPAPTRRVIRSTTVVTRPSEENFISEKKATQEKIIVEQAADNKGVTRRIIRRDPIRRVERIPLKKDGTSGIKVEPKAEKVDLPKPPAPEKPIVSVTRKEITTPKAIPTPSASPGLKETFSRKIIVPPPIIPTAEEVAVPTAEEMAPEITEPVVEAPLVENVVETAAMPVMGELVETPAAEEIAEVAAAEEIAEVAATEEIVEVAATEELAEAAATEELAEAATEEIVEAAEVPAYIPPANLVPDDLTKIEGIGPKISKLLNNAGILTFNQLASRTYGELQDIMDEAGPRYRIARPKSWPEQAEHAAKGDWDSLNDFQNRLRNGSLS